MVRKPFGGMKVDLDCDCSMSDVFGKGMSPSDMTKKLWKHVKSHGKMKK
ncbi:MAG: hypothetical protein V1787_06205 [Candidatus Micrarchaeota archaeon]